MTVHASHPVYRSFVRLYPRDFRQRYGEDLVQHFADLITDRGARAAWTRTSVDLIVTIPRYRLENIMTEQHSATTLHLAITLLAAGGVLSFLTDLYPGQGLVGLVLLLAAVVLAIAQRSTLARAIRITDPNRRRRRLVTAGILALIFAASYIAFLNLIGDTWTLRETLLAAIGTPAMIASPIYLIAGLLTPKAPRRPDQAVVIPL
ncbi:MAG: hypothetical protein ACR2H0_06615 [Candidatus Limnocylindrales bacterium]